MMTLLTDPAGALLVLAALAVAAWVILEPAPPAPGLELEEVRRALADLEERRRRMG